MALDQLIRILVSATLIEMMIAVGLSVTLAELGAVARNMGLIMRALLANYACMPAATVALLVVFHPHPLVAAGFLILAACPGAPYGPPFSSIARADTPTSIGLMVILAGSSALVAPVLLRALLPIVSRGEPISVDLGRMIGTLLATQLIPLCVGLAVRRWRPALAFRLLKPANLISKLLNLVVVVLILMSQYPTLMSIRPTGFLGMLALLAISLATGWLVGGPSRDRRKTVALATSLRNVGVGLVIATGSFGGTPAVSAVLAYGIIEVLGSLLVALWWRKQAAPGARKGAGAARGTGISA